MARLGVNIDHVATIRQARGTRYPDPVQASVIAELAGAHSITIHLREDRRHIQERDLALLKETVQTRLNLEMAPTEEMVAIAVKYRPDQVTLVPERRQELTTEGGLDVAGQVNHLTRVAGALHDAGIVVSAFIDPDRGQVAASRRCGADFVEFHTGRYAEARSPEAEDREYALVLEAAHCARDAGVRINAGHGLHYRNTARIAAIPQMEELNIGHSIIARAILVGLERAVREMCEIIAAASERSTH